MLSDSVFLNDESATERFGKMLALASSELDPVEVSENDIPTQTLGGRIYLQGDLGAGKTTLTRGFMRAYGYTGAVKSPTYTLVEPYEYSSYQIYHFDLYRLIDPEEVEFLGVSDYFSQTNLCLIEWPQNGKPFIPGPDLEILLVIEGSGRRLDWQACSPRGQVIAERLVEISRNL
jgi:tRNA threonylcarbamoyladenosine biosynthesis protein TsaE